MAITAVTTARDISEHSNSKEARRVGPRHPASDKWDQQMVRRVGRHTEQQVGSELSRP